MTGLKDLLRIERARHFLVALAIAATLGVTGFLNPLDWFIWSSHARLLERDASGEIIFVGASDDLSDASEPAHRYDIAHLIEGLVAADAERIFVDVRLEKTSEKDADEAVRTALNQTRVFLVERFRTTPTGPRMISTLPAIAGGAAHVVAREMLDPFGWTWTAELGHREDGALHQSLAGALANVRPAEDGDFRIDYSINYQSVPTISMEEAFSSFERGTAGELFKNKFVVLGNGGATEEAYAAIPGARKVPASMVAILAGETLRIGPGRNIGWPLTLLIFALLLASVLTISRNSGARYRGYALVFVAIPAWFVFTAYARMTVHLSVPVAFIATYAIIRAWNHRSRNASLVDELSGLPNFRALEEDLARQTLLHPVSVVVARIHRFDEVRAILPAEFHGEYVRQVADRFRITDQTLNVYSNAGRYLAWLQRAEDEAQLEAHLHGLRAVFANPLYIDGTPLDVGITFGADATRETAPATKISSATSAVDRTTESHSPVLLAASSSVSDRMWNVSLQAKIDAALKSGQIYVVYQPQFDLPTETLCGFEALVRWNDPERGPIAPSYFIEQCEHAGRMEALTRKVFTESVGALEGSPFSVGRARLSLNVSATMLGDDRVLDILEQTIVTSNLDAKLITIEVTETARIPDLDIARSVLGKIQDRGLRTSIDDFGIGAANLETLLRLPFDELKIDRVFVSRIREDATARQIVQSLIGLGKGLGLEVVAEGVEDRFTLEILKSFGCDAVQGYLLGRPASLSDLESDMARKQERTARSDR